MTITRFANNPIIYPGMDKRMGSNINGPSLIHVPDWVKQPLGRYYLYFAHHDGAYIRLAYSNHLAGPWQVHEPGVLPLQESHFAGHIASPDVHVDHQQQQIRLYYHGSDTATNGGGIQNTRVALSADGLHFQASSEILGEPYFRVFRWQNHYYALAMPGIFYRSVDGLQNFQLSPSPTLFTPAMRHSAVQLRDSTLTVVYSNAGDCPESLLMANIDLTPDWHAWRVTPAVTILQPEHNYEGAHLPLLASQRGMTNEPVRQLRDPALYSEQDKTYLLYAVAGEHGIAIAEWHGL